MLFLRDSVPRRRSSSVEDGRPARIERTTCIRSTPVRFDQLPVDRVLARRAEELVDVRVEQIRGSPVEQTRTSTLKSSENYGRRNKAGPTVGRSVLAIPKGRGSASTSDPELRAVPDMLRQPRGPRRERPFVCGR